MHTSLNNALQTIYADNAHDDDWQKALDACVSAVQCKSATLKSVRSDTDSSSVFNLSGFTHTHSQIYHDAPHGAIDRYHEHFRDYQPAYLKALQSHKPHTLLTDSQIWPDTLNLRQRPDFAYLEEQFGLHHRVSARLNSHAGGFDCVTFLLDSQLDEIPSECLEMVMLLLPHLENRMQIEFILRMQQQQSTALQSALDQVRVGLCVCTENATVIACNSEARYIFKQNDGIELSVENQLICQDAVSTQKLHADIQHAFNCAENHNSTAEWLQNIPRNSDKQPYLLEIVPLPAAVQSGTPDSPQILITIINPEQTQLISIERLRLAYRLTNAESDIYRRVLDGLTNKQIAQLRSVSVETVNAQVASIKSKTGTHRRSHLIRLANQTSPPIGAPLF